MNLDLNQLVKWRREFHRFPEIGWSEFWTTSRIADYLEDLGCFEIFSWQTNYKSGLCSWTKTSRSR